MKFRFMNKVRITGGFYEGFTGTVQDHYAAILNIGGHNIEASYKVKLDGLEKTVQIYEDQLERIER